MKSAFLTVTLWGLCFLAAPVNAKAAPPPQHPTADSTKPKRPSPFDEKVKGSKRSDGLFTLYQDTVTGSLQLYVKKAQLGEEFIYQNFSISGPTSMFLNQSMHRSNFIFKVQKAYDRLEFSRVNTSFYYDPENPISKTKDVDKPEAVVLSEKISGEDSAGYLINADGLYLSEKLDPVRPAAPSGFFGPQFTLGGLNPTKSKYFQVRSFPQNTDVVVDLAYDNPSAAAGGLDITDPRYVRVRMQHSFIQLPENKFQPRRDDPRIGYFGQQVNDQTSISPTPYKDIINRWNLVKKNPNDSLSEPVEPIVFWIENTTPYEYRQTILEAGLKWNAAFEKAGFKNAIQMKIMPDNADWDPSDIRYNVIRWVSSANPSYGAIGPSFVNPRTGEILGADITIEWYSGSATPIFDELAAARKPVPATIQAAAAEPTDYTLCTLASELKGGLLTGMTALETAGADKRTIGEMHKQYLTYLVMHEMGHTLGLNHNMKSSQMWSRKEINDTALTHKWGLIGSVMDYPSINIALNSKDQGDYYTTVAGPYDVWAIQYGYTPFTAKEEDEGLKKIAARSTDSKLAFGNDGDDMRSPGKGMDPRVNVNDLTSDAIGYAEERFQLVNGLMGSLLKKYTKEGQSYAELRSRYAMLQNQRLSAIATVSRYIGGVYIDRSFPEQHSTTKPYTPVPLATQKRAMGILNKYVFAPDAYASDSAVFAYLQPQRRLFNQSAAGDDYKISSTVLSLQINGALAHLLHPTTLQRITNSRMYGNTYSAADVFTDLNKSLFATDINSNVNVYRQYLQTTYVEALLQIVDEKSMYDEVAKAAALNAVQKIKTQLATATATNEETKAHRSHLVYLINKALKED